MADESRNHYFRCSIMARQDLAQSRHDLAQSAMCLSSLNFSHCLAQSSQAFAHPSQAEAESGLCRADNFAASAQYSAQSTQACIVLACSFFPLATRRAQWWKHESHATWQSAHALAHLVKCS